MNDMFIMNYSKRYLYGHHLESDLQICNMNQLFDKINNNIMQKSV